MKSTRQDTFCLCGCGKTTSPSCKYLRGHNRRKNTDNELINHLYTKKLFSCQEIAQFLGLGSSTVRRRLGKIGVNTRNRREAALAAVEKGKNYMQTEEGKDAHRLRMKGHSHNRIFKYDRAFFSEWNSKIAYILGFLVADGCIYRNRIIFVLKDKGFLEKIAKTIGEKPVVYRGGYYHLTYFSHQMVNDLKKLGLGPRKTFTLKPIDIPQNLISHFIRGFFDGDGCFSRYKSHKVWLSVFTNASKPFLEWVATNLPIRGGCLRQRTGNCFELRLGELDSYNLGNFIYQNIKEDDLCLRRKRLLFEQIRKAVLKKGDDAYERCSFGRRIGDSALSPHLRHQ